MANRQVAVVEIPHYKVLLAELEKITNNKKLIAQSMGPAVRYATKPTYDALRSNVSKVGTVTGNLKAAVAIKVKTYSKSGNAVGMVGFIRAGTGSDKQKKKGKSNAYHQHLVEFGTKERFVKGDIASAFKNIDFKVYRGGNGRTYTSGFPRTFFKKGKRGMPLSVGSMPVGGRSGKPPLSNAFEKTKGQINTRLISQTDKTIERLMKKLKKAESK